ncbi:uncharacterized protein H6S33_005934 [Morchella sextelata]|uniref:uncharacterized protein n=1 Tax=Morchella sextelata TaxID=1174677 RepID=UPI001D04BBFD|nr:uncharacterized protein H6S33_005934 [Morchella sextelata]KAH0614048.1 hypothetical protein H6S33_005934 [Morchella sextelata]
MESDGDGVNEFLQRIRELGDKRDREDEERARKLEEEIIAGREARRARRDERARSLSPQKDSPLSAPLSLRSSVLEMSLSRPGTAEDTNGGNRREDSVESAMDKLTGRFSASTLTDAETSGNEQEKAPRTLSWQRRPKSFHSSVSRPTSLLYKPEEPQSEEEPEKRRSQIAQNLGSKDPSWFRQTSDRGATSGALRKAQDESMDLTAKMALPGMSSSFGGMLGKLGFEEDSTSEADRPALSKRDSNETLSSTSTFRGRSDSLHSASQLTSSTSSSGISRHTRGNSFTSSISARFDPSLVGGGFVSEDGFTRPPAMSPSQGRISPERKERTPSPTKGLGGFVQSALLKREGSINKRWSNSQQLGSLSRNSSTASNRHTYGNLREAAAAAAADEEEIEGDDLQDGETTEDESQLSQLSQVSQVEHSRGSSLSEPRLASPGTSGDIQLSPPPRSMSPPASPTKTFDQKRWSPTKSSWLESALKKGTDSNAPMKAYTPPKEKTQAKIIETKFPDPMATRPPTGPKPASIGLKKPLSIPNIPPLRPSSIPDIPVLRPSGSLDTVKLNPEIGEKPVVPSSKPVFNSPMSNRTSVFEKPPPPPKETINFRAGLKPRSMTDAAGKGEHLPFLNAMTRLRSTKTNNYVPNNELKDRILAGKANLQATAGPQKNKAPDPLKEMVLSAKASLTQSERPVVPRPVESPKAAIVTRPRPSSFSATKQNSAPGRLELKEKGPSLASRFNPGLANLLQRGPPPTSGRSESSNAAGSQQDDSEPSEGKQLTHMTKARARGPKRRAPTKFEGSDVLPAKEAPRSTPSAKDIFSSPVIKQQAPQTSPKPITPKPITFSKPFDLVPKLSPKVETATGHPQFASAPKDAPKTEKVKPPTPAKSPLLKATSASSLREMFTQQSSGTKSPLSEKSLVLPEPSLSSSATSRISLSRRTSTNPNINELNEDEEPASIKTKSWGAPAISRTSSFVSRGDDDDEDDEDSLAPLENTRSRDEPSQIFGGFFKGSVTKTPRLDLDISGILMANRKDTTEEVQSLKTELSEITGYGKLQPVPQEYENVLFDESMYVCIHTFKTQLGAKGTEVYLWSGDKVSEPAVEDALLFARKLARENDGKLIRLRQGRETSAFFQALGGIVTTRRGSRTKMITENPFVLCARHFMGSIAVDEVDCRASSLCSGFPFIVSAKGRVFLWKGKGSTAEEIGVARLVASEMSKGEVQEIDENSEPDMFFDILDGSSEDRASADYWHLKPAHTSYNTRLFRIDLESHAKVIEVSPYCQSDLNQSEIYVVDAFFELYIVLGANSQSKRPEFQSALQFAQDYAILAATVDDRPFIPVSSVIVGGAPREFKVLFRNWEDAKIPTSWQPSRKPSLRLVGLTAAMEAMKVIE